jgi:Na+/melibiose symporter-like transporter
VTRAAVPPARRFSVWLGKRVAFAAAFLVWLYGALVYVVTRVVARVLLVFVALLSGALRWAGPRLWSSARKLAGHARDLSARNSFSSR